MLLLQSKNNESTYKSPDEAIGNLRNLIQDRLILIHSKKAEFASDIHESDLIVFLEAAQYLLEHETSLPGLPLEQLEKAINQAHLLINKFRDQVDSSLETVEIKANELKGDQIKLDEIQDKEGAELESISGIGPTTRATLVAAGIKTIDALVDHLSSPEGMEFLMQLPGFASKKTQNLAHLLKDKIVPKLVERIEKLKVAAELGDLHHLSTPTPEKPSKAEQAMKKRVKELRRLATLIHEYRLHVRHQTTEEGAGVDEGWKEDIQKKQSVILNRFRQSAERGEADELIEAIDMMYEMGRAHDLENKSFSEDQAGSPTGRKCVEAYKFILASFALTHRIQFSSDVLELLQHVADSDEKYEWLHGKSFYQVMVEAHYRNAEVEEAEAEFLARLSDVTPKRRRLTKRIGPEGRTKRRHMSDYASGKNMARGGSADTAPAGRQTFKDVPKPRKKPKRPGLLRLPQLGSRNERRRGRVDVEVARGPLDSHLTQLEGEALRNSSFWEVYESCKSMIHIFSWLKAPKSRSISEAEYDKRKRQYTSRLERLPNHLLQVFNSLRAQDDFDYVIELNKRLISLHAEMKAENTKLEVELCQKSAILYRRLLEVYVLTHAISTSDQTRTALRDLIPNRTVKAMQHVRGDDPNAFLTSIQGVLNETGATTPPNNWLAEKDGFWL